MSKADKYIFEKLGFNFDDYKIITDHVDEENHVRKLKLYLNDYKAPDFPIMNNADPIIIDNEDALKNDCFTLKRNKKIWYTRVDVSYQTKSTFKDYVISVDKQRKFIQNAEAIDFLKSVRRGIEDIPSINDTLKHYIDGNEVSIEAYCLEMKKIRESTKKSSVGDELNKRLTTTGKREVSHAREMRHILDDVEAFIEKKNYQRAMILIFQLGEISKEIEIEREGIREKAELYDKNALGKKISSLKKAEQHFLLGEIIEENKEKLRAEMTDVKALKKAKDIAVEKYMRDTGSEKKPSPNTIENWHEVYKRCSRSF